MRKFLKKCTITALLGLLVLLLKWNLTPYAAGNKGFASKLNEMKAQNYNTVVFGSSAMMRQFNTPLFDSLMAPYHLESYNIGYPGINNPELYYLFENFIHHLPGKDHNIKYAFLELRTLKANGKENMSTTRGSYFNTLKTMQFIEGYLADSRLDAEEKKQVKQFYWKGFFHKAFDFSIELATNPFRTHRRGKQGYYPLESQNAEMQLLGLNERRAQFLADTSILSFAIEAASKVDSIVSYETHVNGFFLHYLLGLRQKAQKKGIQLLFILPPRMKQEDYEVLLPICKEIGMREVIMLASYPENWEFYVERYSYDKGHLNSRGAAIFTTRIAQQALKILEAKPH